MYCLTRIRIFLLTLCTSMFCWQPAFGEFTPETCMELNATANITCTREDSHTIIAFTNKDSLKIYVSDDYERVTISCLSTDENELETIADLPKVQLGQLNDITIDGCLPFDDIFQQLGIRTGEMISLRRGRTSTRLKRDHLAHLTGVTKFELSGFDQLDADVLADLVDIKNIDLTRVEGTLPEGLLVPISEHLSELRMREYGKNTLPAGLFAPLNRLKFLDLSRNELDTIANGSFKNLYNLTDLDLSNNLLTHVPADVFHSMRNLIHLFLANNRLKQLELGTFATLSTLTYLDMKNNALELKASTACSIFDGLTNLRDLELNNNSLSVYCLPHQMTSVRVVASDNQISELLVPTGKSVPGQLILLDVRYNSLQHLSADVLQYLHDSQTELLLSNNPWQCDCESVQWLNFIKLNNKLVKNLTELSCADGRTVGEVIQLSPSDICKQLQQWYYIAAITVLMLLAVAAFTAAWLYRRSARRNSGM